MSKQSKHNHNPRNPNICRNCKVNTIGKNRMAFGHTVCQACSTKILDQSAQAAEGKSELMNHVAKLLSEQGKGNSDEQP